MLRRRRGHEQLGAAPSLAAAVPTPPPPQAEPAALSIASGVGTRGEPYHPGAQQQQQKGSTPTAAGRAAADGEPDPRIARLVRKLSSKKWVVLYDSLKATFTLQAEGIAREVVFAATAAAAGTAAREDQGKGDVDACGGRGASADLEGLRGCVAAWEAYKDWCEEVRAGFCVFS